MGLTEDNVIQALTKLGFKEYQAKVYSSLVSLGQASASEIYKVSGVPRPRVYDTLKELIDLGAVNFYQSRPVYYKAVEPTHVVEHMRKKFLDAGDEAIKELEKIGRHETKGEFDLIWVLRGDMNIKQKIKNMINDARKEVFIRFSFPEKYFQFESQLKIAKMNGVILKSLIFEFDHNTLKKIGKFNDLIEFRRVNPSQSDPIGILKILANSMVDFPFKDNFNNNLVDMGLVITDVEQSLYIFGDQSNFDRAIWSGVRIMVLIQRTIFEYLWQNSKEIKK